MTLQGYIGEQSNNTIIEKLRARGEGLKQDYKIVEFIKSAMEGFFIEGKNVEREIKDVLLREKDLGIEVLRRVERLLFPSIEENDNSYFHIRY